MRNDFEQALRQHQPAFGIELDETAVSRLAEFYELVLEHNPLLHLVGPCTPEEFAIRHILESLALLPYLPTGAHFADVGAGAGLPSIPCLQVRDDLKAVLIESKERKAAYLEQAIPTLDLSERAMLAKRQFAETDISDCTAITCRALDKFAQKLPQLARWSKSRQMLLFGGPNLADALQALRLKHVQKLMPLSEQRFLFVVEPQK